MEPHLSGEPSDRSRVGAILLAAGAGSRFAGDTHKLHAHLVTPHGDQPLWQRAVENARRAGLAGVLVVTGAVHLPAIAAADEERSGVDVVHCAQWSHGQAASLHAGLCRASELGWDAAVIGLADQPGLLPAAWAAVADADPAAPIVVATYDGRRGPHPVRLRREVWPLLAAHGEAAARELIHAHPQWVTEVECVGSAVDIDTVEDLHRWRNW